MGRLNIDALDRAIKDRHDGDIPSFSKAFGISRSTYYQWRRENRCADSFMVALEEYFKVPPGTVTPFVGEREIDPDLFYKISEQIKAIATKDAIQLSDRAVIFLTSIVYTKYQTKGFDEELVKSHIKMAQE